MLSWTNFGRPDIFGKDTPVLYTLSSCVHWPHFRGSVKSSSVRNGIVLFFRLIDISDVVSDLFLCFCRSDHDFVLNVKISYLMMSDRFYFFDFLSLQVRPVSTPRVWQTELKTSFYDPS